MAECWNIDSVFIQVVYVSEDAITTLRAVPSDRVEIETIANGRDWAVRVGDIEVRIACSTTGARAWFDAWIGDTLVPPALRRVSLGSVGEGTRCAHRDGRSRDGYRAPPDDEAIGLCGACHEPVCRACLAIDRVMCARCFSAAMREYVEWDRQRRAVLWGVGSIAGGIVTATTLALHAFAASAVCGMAAVLGAVGGWRAYRESPKPPAGRPPRS